MSRLRILLGGVSLSGLVFAAGFLAARHPDLRGGQGSRLEKVPNLERPGASLNTAAEFFAKLNPPPAPPPPPPQPPPPPKPDIGLIFRQQVRALIQQGTGPAILLERDGIRRVLSLGDVFEDGWRITALNSQQVELTKGKLRRRLGFFVKPQEFQSEIRP